MKWEPNRCPECGEPAEKILETTHCQAVLQPVQNKPDDYEYEGTTIYDYGHQIPFKTADGKDVLEGAVDL